MEKDLRDFYQKIATAKSDNDACDHLVELIKKTIGCKLVTLMTLDEKQGVACRTYSNMPIEYPVSGTKPMEKNIWSEIVLERGETFVANTIEEIADVFFDHELIQSLGCESVVNIPIFIQNECMGSVNILDVKGHYTPELVEKSESLKLPSSLCFLMLKSQTSEEK